MRLLHAAWAPITLLIGFACSATNTNNSASGVGGGGHGGGSEACDTCIGTSYTPCNPNGTPGAPIVCADACVPGKGCVLCVPGSTTCVGNEVHECSADGKDFDKVVETCDVAAGKVCSEGACAGACQVASDQPSNVGCEFWAVDLDQQDGLNDPASAPWGVALSNAGESPADVTIEINTAPPGQPVSTMVVQQLTVSPGALEALVLPTRELDCGVKPNDYTSPGTCLSSNAYRITSTSPIVVYQFNVFTNAYSNDASLLLPTNALGKFYRVIGWGAGHPIPIAFPGIGTIVDRSYVTIVGVEPATEVTVKPSWRIKGNPPVAATPAGGVIKVTIGPFDVLNLETDDATFQDDPATMADLSGTLVTSSKPVAVFSGVETTGAPGSLQVPTPPGWMSGDSCCLDHLEDQLFPAESVGTQYVVTRSPVRSTGSFREPDVLRFVGVAEPATVLTNLPSPFSTFTLQPGEVKTTWTQDNVIVSSDKPIMVGQILVSNQYVDGQYLGDPSLTIYPPAVQYRTEYVILTPPSWNENWVVIAAEPDTKVTIDGLFPTCTVEPAGMVGGKTYESRVCPLTEGVHKLSGDKPFGIVAYGYGAAGSYAFAGGADVKRVYDPPIIE